MKRLLFATALMILLGAAALCCTRKYLAIKAFPRACSLAASLSLRGDKNLLRKGSRELKLPVLKAQPYTSSSLLDLSEEVKKDFPGATVLEAAEVNGPELGQKTRLHILKTHCKYPFIRTEEVLDIEKDSLVIRKEMVADHLLVRLKEGEDPEVFLKKLGPHALSIAGLLPERSLYQVNLSSHSLTALPEGLDALDKFSASDVLGEPDFIAHACTVPNDPSFSYQWALSDPSIFEYHATINAKRAWSIRTDASSVIVALIDTGVRYTHQDLLSNMWHSLNSTSLASVSFGGAKSCGYNFYGSNNDPLDTDGHGTACAGIIAADGNNGIGGVGICWKAQLMVLKAGEKRIVFESDIDRALFFASSWGAKIFNCSFGWYEFSQITFDIINDIRRSGGVLVCAAGNDSHSNDTYPVYPANYHLDNIVAVAATTSSDQLAPFSNYGVKTVHLGAPGAHIFSTAFQTDSSYGYFNGTSVAAPHVTGTLALLMAECPNHTYKEYIQHLLATTDKIPSLQGKTISGGRLNLGKALTQRISPEDQQPVSHRAWFDWWKSWEICLNS